MTAPIVHHFRACRVEVWPAATYCQTVFADGARVPAAPQDTAGYRETAQACGYGADTYLLMVEHEISHVLLSEARGLPYSPTLWAVAHGEPLPRGQVPEEECTVLAFQAWANGDADALDILEMRGFTLAELERLRAQLHALTRLEVPV